MIFQATAGLGRQRTRKTKIARALHGASAKGHDLEKVVQGTLACLSGPDATNPELGGQRAAHKVIASGAWEAWVSERYTPEMLD